MAKSNEVIWWMRIREEFLNSNEIKSFVINGKYEIIVVLEYLILLSKNTEGRLVQIIDGEEKPISISVIQKYLGIFDYNTLKKSILALIVSGLVERQQLSDQVTMYVIKNHSDFISKDTTKAVYFRNYRSQKDCKEFANANDSSLQMQLQMQDNNNNYNNNYNNINNNIYNKTLDTNDKNDKNDKNILSNVSKNFTQPTLTLIRAGIIGSDNIQLINSIEELWNTKYKLYSYSVLNQIATRIKSYNDQSNYNDPISYIVSSFDQNIKKLISKGYELEKRIS